MYSEELKEAGVTSNLARGPTNRLVIPNRRFTGEEYDFDSGDEHIPSDSDSSDSEDERRRGQHLDPILEEERNRLRNPARQEPEEELMNNDPYSDTNWEHYVRTKRAYVL